MNTNTNMPDRTPEQTIQVMQILAGALTGSVVMMGAVLFITKQPVIDTHLFAENIKNPLHLVLFLMGFVILLARIPLANTIFAAALESAKPQDLKSVLPLYFVPLIMKIALAEAAAIMGFVSTQTSGEATPFVILAAAAIVAIIKEFPTVDKIKERVKVLKPNLQLQ